MLNPNTSYKFYLIVLYLWGVINSPLGIGPLAIGPMKNREGPIDEGVHSGTHIIPRSFIWLNITYRGELAQGIWRGTTMLRDAPRTSTPFKI